MTNFETDPVLILASSTLLIGNVASLFLGESVLEITFFDLCDNYELCEKLNLGVMCVFMKPNIYYAESKTVLELRELCAGFLSSFNPDKSTERCNWLMSNPTLRIWCEGM
jgi:hypothetical protein